MKPSVRDEEGFALVTGILVSAVVMTLSISAVALSIHNTDASSYDHRRLLSVNAAEAGIDAYYALLGSTSYAQIPTATAAGTCILTGTLPGTPSATYTVTPLFYPTKVAADSGAGGTACPQSSPTRSTYVVLRSLGAVAGSAAPRRTMESRARLLVSTSTAAFPGAAIYGSQSVTLAANLDLYSASGKNDADVYSDGNLSVTTRSSIRGNIYVQGTATVANGNFWARGNLWANGAVTVSGGRIDGAVTSSTSTINVSGNTQVGSAKAGGAITVQNPAKIFGTQSPNTTGIPAPPTYSYPTYTWNANDWEGPPYLVTETSCGAAQTRLNSWVSGPLYIRLTGCSDLLITDFPASSNLPGNLGIISAGSLTLSTGLRLATSPTPRNVYLFAGVPVSGSPTCGNFLANSNSGTGPNLNTLVYTPQTCSATMNSNSSFASGQIFSGNVSLKSNSPMTFSAVQFPGTSQEPVGSLVDVVYKREVVTT